MKAALKRMAGSLSPRWQQRMMRLWYRQQIATERFEPEARELEVLRQLVQPGDWVLDVGANVGHYAVACSRLVGPSGRVVAFEPVPETFALLCSNCMALPTRNVTLFNAAASDASSARGMTVPAHDSGLVRSCEAHFSGEHEAEDVRVYTMVLDDLSWPARIALVKIDTEGHELGVLRGMTKLLRSDRPTIIVEASTVEIIPFLGEFGYRRLEVGPEWNYVLVHESRT